MITSYDFATLVWNAATVGYCHDIKFRAFGPGDPNLNHCWVFLPVVAGHQLGVTVRLP